MILVLTGSSLYAVSWKFDDTLLEELHNAHVSDDVIQEFYDNYTAEELLVPDKLFNLYSNLLDYISLLSIDLNQIDPLTYEVVARYSRKITSINIDVELSDLEKYLRRELGTFLGVEYEDQVKSRIEQRLNRALTYRGYYKHLSRVNVKFFKNSVNIDVDIKLDYPCSISSITRPDFPIGVFFGVSRGDICDRVMVNEKINRIRVQLKDRQYLNENISDPYFDYDEKTNTAVLRIDGSIGKRIVVDIDVNGGIYSLTDFFKEDPKNLDLASIDVGSIKDELKSSYMVFGYEDVAVSDPVVEENSDEIVYSFKVDLNTRYRFAGFEFHGNSFFKSSELEKIFSMDSFLDPYFNYEKLKSGVEYVKTEYRKQGFWNIKIQEPKIVKDPNLQSVRVVVFIEEGSRRVFSGINISGTSMITKQEVLSLMKFEPNEGLDYAQVSAFEKSLKELYISKGYLNVQIKFQPQYRLVEDESKYETKLNVFINEKERVHVGRITVSGNNKVRTKAIEREFRFKTFDVFDPTLIDLSRRAVMASGLFSKVDFSYGSMYILKGKPVIDINVQVVESSSGSVSFGPGWSLYKGGRFSIDSSYNNLTGLARKVFSRIQLSEEWKQKPIDSSTIIGRTISAGYMEPYLKQLPIAVTVSYTDRTTADETRLFTKTFDLSLFHNFRHTFTNSGVGLILQNKRSREEGSTDQKEAYLKYIGGNYGIGSVGLEFSWDGRSNVSWPTSGGRLNTEYILARKFLLGDVKYNYFKFVYSHYFSLPRSVVLACSMSFFRYWNIHRTGYDSVPNFLPVSQAGHLGGADSVRGFKERSLGPYVTYKNKDKQEKSVNLGGSMGSTIKTELRYKFDSWNLISTLFLDMGNVFFTDEEVSSFAARVNNESKIVDNVYYQFKDLFKHPEYIWTKNYKSVGLSLGYFTPLGSISLSYGIPLYVNIPKYAQTIPRADKDSPFLLRGKVHFSIGSLF